MTTTEVSMPSATEEHLPISTSQQQPGPPQPASGAPALACAARFLREYPLRILAISAAVLTPCFWHRHIEAGDLASHTYNAWLAQLIARGQAPGLWLARQWNNVLFDVTLSGLGNLIGLRAAEKIAVAMAVLIFFWGAFALISAAARRPSWFVLPCLAIFAYGWTFEMGFLNFYISLGLSFFGLALLWRGQGWERALVFALAPLTWMAHPLGTVLLVTVGAYLTIVRIVAGRFQLYATAVAALLVLAARFYVAAHYLVRWSPLPAVFFNGADQMWLYGPRYRIPEFLLLGLFLTFLVADLIARRTTPGLLDSYALPLQLYGLSLLAAWSVPSGIFLPQYAAPLDLLTERFTSICAVFACCLLGVMKPRKWHLLALSVVAATFFVLLYQDTGKLDRIETVIDRYVTTLPPGQRVASTIWTFLGSRVFINHIVDRACIGHAFSYGNYEPSTGQFRVRALPGNPIVVAGFSTSEALQTGRYIVRQQDLPMVQIYQCDLSMTRLCVRQLSAGEANGRYGVQPVVR
jgi:hypothetical protein